MRRPPLLLLTVLSVAGCGGSGHGGSPSSPSSAALSYRNGVTSLGSALASGTDRTANLTSAQKSFDTAYAGNPNDPRVAMGYALCTTALDATSLDSTVEGKAAATRLSLLSGLGTRLGSGSKSNLAAFLPILAARPQARSNGTTLASLAASLHKAIDRLTDARVEALEANPLTVAYGDVTVKIGTVEGYALRSAAKAELGLVDGSLAYNLDSGTYDPSAPFLTRFATQVAAGTDLTPAMYLPTGSYGKPASNAGALLADLGAEWTGTANDGETALARLNARTGAGWLTDLDPVSDAEHASLTSELNELRAAVAGPTSVPVTLNDGTTMNLTVDLAVPIASPPADLRAFDPTLRPATADDGTTTLTPASGSVADPTLGGLVPSGLPAALLYDRTLTVDPTTTQGEVADWAFPLSALL